VKPKTRAGPRPDLNDRKTFDWLYHHLVILGKSKKQLAEELGVSQQTINTWTKPYDFGVYFHSQSNVGKHSFPLPIETRQSLSDTIKQQYQQGREPVNRKQREVRTCKICGSEFRVIKNSQNPKQRDRTTCSRRCANEKHSQYMQSLPAKVDKVQVTCGQCGKPFEVYPSLGHIQFCSYECTHANRRGKTYEELYGAERSRKAKEKLAIARARQFQRLITRPVAELVSTLTPHLGMPELEYQIAHYSVDICYPSLWVVIEVDGNYWHNYPIGLPRDAEKTEALTTMGWKVLRYWESHILADPSVVVQQILEELDHD
jgi:hypothetical protein